MLQSQYRDLKSKPEVAILNFKKIVLLNIEILDRKSKVYWHMNIYLPITITPEYAENRQKNIWILHPETDLVFA